MLTNRQRVPSDNYLWEFTHDIPQPRKIKISLKLNYRKCHLSLCRGSDLIKLKCCTEKSYWLWLMCNVWYCWFDGLRWVKDCYLKQYKKLEIENIGNTTQAGVLSATGINSHYSDVMMGAVVSQIIILTIVYSTVHLCADQRKPPASLPFLWGIPRTKGQ